MLLLLSLYGIVCSFCDFFWLVGLVWLYFGQKMVVVVFELWLYLRVGVWV